jgi:hypothetical protein
MKSKKNESEKCDIGRQARRNEHAFGSPQVHVSQHNSALPRVEGAEHSVVPTWLLRKVSSSIDGHILPSSHRVDICPTFGPTAQCDVSFVETKKTFQKNVSVRAISRPLSVNSASRSPPIHTQLHCAQDTNLFHARGYGSRLAARGHRGAPELQIVGLQSQKKV